MPGGVAIQRSISLPELPRQLAMLELSPAEIDWRPTLRDWSVYLATKAKESFDRGASPDGTPWAPLKRQRNRRRDKRGRRAGGGTGQKPLRDTGLLMASMSAAAGVQGSVREFGPASLTQGTAIFYGSFHQEGGRHLPARPFAGVTNAMADMLANIAADRLMRQYFGRAA